MYIPICTRGASSRLGHGTPRADANPHHPPPYDIYTAVQMIVTAGTLEESREALELAKTRPNLYSTVGVHPTRCLEFFGSAAGGRGGDPEAHVAALAAVLEEGKSLGKVRILILENVAVIGLPICALLRGNGGCSRRGACRTCSSKASLLRC